MYNYVSLIPEKIMYNAHYIQVSFGDISWVPGTTTSLEVLQKLLIHKYKKKKIFKINKTNAHKS